MATYEYGCPAHGSVDVTYPIGAAPASIECRVCGTPARRVYSAPRTSFSSPKSKAISGAIERAEKSAHEPEVVTSLPAKPSRGPGRPINPQWLRLPRR